jgi:predicted CoA-binding protein
LWIVSSTGISLTIDAALPAQTERPYQTIPSNLDWFMDFQNPPDNEIRAILSNPTTVAVVGCSNDPDRDSLKIAKLLRTKGFRVIPVNPQLAPDALLNELGERCYPDLDSIPEPVQIVDVFRRPEHLPVIAEQAARKGARILWGQLGVVNLEAAERARKAGMTVVMDRCPAIEYRRLF